MVHVVNALSPNTWGIVLLVLFVFHLTALLQLTQSCMPRAWKAPWFLILLQPVLGLAAYYALARPTLRRFNARQPLDRAVTPTSEQAHASQAPVPTRPARLAVPARPVRPPVPEPSLA